MDHRTCIVCGISKPLTDFMIGGKLIRRRCKACRTREHREWVMSHREHLKRYRESRRDHDRIRKAERFNSPEYCEKQRKYWREWAQKRRAELADALESGSRLGRGRHLIKHKYGLTIGDFMKMAERQAFRCAICLRPESDMIKQRNVRRMLSVDHDHKTGKPRGLLCRNCNQGIGHLKDDPYIVASALRYLRSFQKISKPSTPLLWSDSLDSSVQRDSGTD